MFGKISYNLRSAPGQRSTDGRTSSLKNLNLLAQEDGSEGRPCGKDPQGTKELSQGASGKQRLQPNEV